MLASSSSRRIELLELAGVPFEVIEPGEVEVTSGKAVERVLENALLKARTVAKRIGEGLILGVDTVVTIDDQVLGKPKADSEAVEMLRLLSGRVHRVITGIVVLDASSGRTESDVAETTVRMRQLSEIEIAAYVTSGEPLGKAGGYAIQGLGALLIAEIHGCFYNIVGLPLSRLVDLLRRFDVDLMARSEMN